GEEERPAPAPRVAPPGARNVAPPKPAAGIMGLEPTTLDGAGAATDSGATLDIEPTAFDEKPAPRPPSIIEQEASASLLPEHELLDDDTPRDPASPPQFDEMTAPIEEPSYDSNLGGDPLGLTISHDSSTLHVDLPPGGELGEAGFWQQQDGSDFGLDLGQDPTLLRSDAIGLDDPLASTAGARDLDT